MKRYNPKEIEPKWQAKWEADKIYQATEDPAKPKKYVLEYFPYPSGAAMHVGHVRNYAIGDATARFNRMQGYNVLHPMGWDAFGLPAENYAIKHHVSPRAAIDENTERFKEQLMQMGFSYDWSREIDSTDPKYYRWTQWFFLLLFKKGLAYQQESLQWWCPFDKTVLANEQVENGRCWRCGHEVEKKSLKQWFFRITKYADRLLNDLDDLDWSEAIKSMQRNWIGRSSGAEVEFILDKDLHNQDFLFLHAFQDNAESVFWPWLKHELEAKGAKVTALNLPNSSKPNIDEQIKYVMQNYTFTEQTTIVCHSLGGVLALKLLPRIDTTINKLILAGTPLHTDNFKDGVRQPELDDCCDWQFDFDGVKRKAKDIHVLSSTNDHVVPISHGQELAEKLDTTLEEYETTKPHFNGDSEPSLLREIIPSINVFTTRPDTLFGATFLVLAPEHPLVKTITTEEHKQHVNNYLQAVAAKSDIERQNTDIEKTGVFTGAYAINPVNDAKVPIWIADYVLSGYGTGAIMAVPAHDERDWAFAKKFDLPIVRVVKNDAPDDACSHDEGIMINSNDYNDLPSDQAREKIVADLEKQNVAKEEVNYKIRDWLISRQRYWGAPIPIIHCPRDGAVAVPDDQLPVVLPEIKSYEPSGDGRSPLANIPEFVNTTCPKCGGAAQRETDTMDGFACSSWYFLRFADPHNDQAPFDKAKADFWLPVDDYIGGAEHAVMHLLYARFWTKVMYDEKMIDFEEPFTKLRNHGMILAPDGQKMSKSKDNTIEPDSLINQGYGADSIRIMELFIGPWDQAVNWSVEGLGGAFRFLQRLWTLVQEFNEVDMKQTSESSQELLVISHRTIKKVSQDLQAMNFNTAISAMMEEVNELYKIKATDNYVASDWPFALESLLQLLAPFAPHIAEELWQQLGHKGSIHSNEWPKWDDKYLVSQTMTIAIQINGKLRAELELPTDTSEEQVISAAKANERVAAYLDSQQVVKTIYVPKKLVNLVLQ